MRAIAKANGRPLSEERLDADLPAYKGFLLALERMESYTFAVEDEPAFHFSLRPWRSEEHTSELQSQFHLVCRLLLEKKKQKHTSPLRLSTASTYLAILAVSTPYRISCIRFPRHDTSHEPLCRINRT